MPEFAALHEYRRTNNINYTDQHDPTKQQCPAHARRIPETINRWYGNRASKPDLDAETTPTYIDTDDEQTRQD
jgi:hypothetical protein